MIIYNFNYYDLCRQAGAFAYSKYQPVWFFQMTGELSVAIAFQRVIITRQKQERVNRHSISHIIYTS